MVTLPIHPAPALVPGGERESASAVRRGLAPVFLYFTIAGVGTVMLGPALPLLAARWSLPDARLGTLFFAFFAGQFCGSWLATPRLRLSLVLGAIGAALGLLALAHAGAVSAHLALFCAGMGLAAGLTAGNVLVGAAGGNAPSSDGPAAPDAGPSSRGGSSGGRERSSRSRSRFLALLNSCWGVGAIVCPLLLSLSLRPGRYHAEPGQLFFSGLAAAFAACALLLAWRLPRQAQRSSSPGEALAGIRWRVFGLFGATLMLYVGVENCLGGWLPIYAQRLSRGGALAGRASAIALCFWICELTGRGLTAVALQRIAERRLYHGALALLIATGATLALTPRLSTLAIFALTALAGLGLAPLFPLAVSFLLARTGNHPRVGKVFAISSLGGTLLPWLTGLVSTHFQSLRLGLAVPAWGAVLLLLLSRFLPAATRGDPAEIRP